MNNILNKKIINKNLILVRKHINLNTLIIVLLVLYISCLSIYTPRHIIALVNHPMSKLIILGLIMYYGKNNLLLGLFMALALLVTINLDNTLSITEDKLRENFTSTEEEDDDNDDDDDDNDDDDNDDDEDDDNDDDDDNDSEDDNDDNNDDDDDHDHNNNDEEDDDNDSEDDESEEEQFKSFDKTKLKPSKNVKDSFSKLHNAIHDLQGMVKKSKKS